MSADNWAVCPRCWSRATAVAVEARQAVISLYGHLPVDEFDARRAALVEPDVEDFRTFREDYDFYGAEQGEIHAEYTGRCTKCGLEVDLQARKSFWTGER